AASSVAAADTLTPVATAAPIVDEITDLPADVLSRARASAEQIPTPPTAVVRELRPRLADARKDTDGINERGCGLALPGTTPPRCALGSPAGSMTVALVGDSHAAQWAPALEAIASSRGWTLVPFTKDSCIFLDMRIVSIHLEREYTECA